MSPVIVPQSETVTVDEIEEELILEVDEKENEKEIDLKRVSFDSFQSVYDYNGDGTVNRRERVSRRKRKNPQYKILGRFIDEDGIEWVPYTEVWR